MRFSRDLFCIFDLKMAFEVQVQLMYIYIYICMYVCMCIRSDGSVFELELLVMESIIKCALNVFTNHR